MLIAEFAVPGAVGLPRYHQLQPFLGAAHSYMQQAAFFFDLFVALCVERRDASLDDVQDIDVAPFQPLGRMNRRKNERVFIFSGRLNLTGRAVGRIKGQLRQEALPRMIGRCNLRQLANIGDTRVCIVIQSLEATVDFQPSAKVTNLCSTGVVCDRAR